ncbi:ThiF family adenylyltransferase [Cytophagaceae bacterium ABcell3]|nr:ThiF family adenylyltransferase [Cytophagaceae bacterium ABcell3]
MNPSRPLNSNNHTKPVMFRMNKSEDFAKFYTFLETNKQIYVYDTIEEQIQELIKIQNPSEQFSEEDLKSGVASYLDGMPAKDFGVWVYYPWSNRLVHLLPEKEFSEVRTSRNIFKITPEERNILSSKAIGVIGMSVGSSIALTMAVERIFGEIRIADFDSLELSNLNRVRTGVHNLGLKKTIVTAREISEIDPFLKVTCMHDAVNENNLKSFLLSPSKLDVLVEECDSMDVKLLARQVARSFKIPVVMETNDRGLLDIERFDLEPNRPVLHGLIEESEIYKLKDMSMAEKAVFVKKILGYDNLSERGKYSMSRVGKEITSWPQLASAVALGSGIATDVCRRILLDQLKVSGRFYIDLESIVC